MSKPKHKFRGVPYLDIYTKWSRRNKGECAYKDNISHEHIMTYRKTYHIERDADAGWKGAGRCDRKVQNAKRRPVVQARLDKLNRYVKRAWKGYVFGRLPNTVSRRP